MSTSINRRTFIQQTSSATIGLGLVGPLSALHGPKAPNNHIVVGVMGVNGRGRVLAQSFAANAGSEVKYICDVDTRAIENTIGVLSESQQVERDGQTRTLPPIQERRPEGVVDFRRMLDDQDVDAIVIAAPDHWHAPATILALQAGKHVYVEKPCGHNAREGELMIEAQQKYGLVVQMGNQQRSSPESTEVIQLIRDGLIGRPYYAKCWYANRRGSIGRGKYAAIPDWLDYDLWQGPAPHMPYRDNLVHYNWHWFWNWGTGEICNNAAHELDICRWALGVDYPVRVTSSGGRYHFDDDWEFYDTQVASFDFADGQTIVWEGRSCNAFPFEGKGRGSSIHGENGTVVMDRSGYVVYDNQNNEIRRNIHSGQEASLDTRGGGRLTDLHVANFLDTIRGDAVQTSPIDEGHKSVLLCHLGNVAQETGRALTCSPLTGRILGDAEAMQYWSRDYEPGWEIKV